MKPDVALARALRNLAARLPEGDRLRGDLLLRARAAEPRPDGKNPISDLAKFRVALRSRSFSHLRVRQWCGVQCIYVYHIASTSPSGVLLAASVEATEFTLRLANERKTP